MVRYRRRVLDRNHVFGVVGSIERLSPLCFRVDEMEKGAVL
jgi:hypothetical protein